MTPTQKAVSRAGVVNAIASHLEDSIHNLNKAAVLFTALGYDAVATELYEIRDRLQKYVGNTESVR